MLSFIPPEITSYHELVTHDNLLFQEGYMQTHISYELGNFADEVCANDDAFKRSLFMLSLLCKFLISKAI